MDDDELEPPRIYVSYDVVSLGFIANGWTVIYINRPPLAAGQPAWWELDLIGFALYEVTHKAYPTGESSRVKGLEIHGVVDCGGYFGPPHEAGNFWCYRSPRQEIPTDIEVAEELDRRGWT